MLNLPNILSVFYFVRIPCELSVSILEQAVPDFVQEKKSPRKEISFSYDNNRLFDLEFFVDVTDHLNHLNM